MSTELLTYQAEQKTPLRRFIRDGVEGNYQIVLEMVRVIRETVRTDRTIERVAKELLTSRGFDGFTDTKQILRVVLNFVQDRVIYIQDLAGKVESIKDAHSTLSDGFGDCDDLTVTIASLLGCLGFENVYIALAKYDEQANFSHVYTVVYIDDKSGIQQRFALDGAIPDGRLNNEVKALEIKEIPVFSDIEGLDGFSGIPYQLKHIAKTFGKSILGAIPDVVNFLPLDFLSGSALATGTSLVSQVTNKPLSLNETASKINRELDKICVALTKNQIALDLAKRYAIQLAVQLNTVKARTDDLTYKQIKNSVESKLAFINNFEQIALENGWTVTHLNPDMIRIVGMAGLGFGAYKLYKYFKKG